MGIFDRIAEQAALNQPPPAAPAHAAGGEAAPVVLPPPAAAAPASAPGGEVGPDVTALAPAVVDQRISRPAEPAVVMPPKPAEIDTGVPAAPGSSKGEMGPELGKQIEDAQAAREPMNVHMVDERGIPTAAEEPTPSPEPPKDIPAEAVPQVASKAKEEELPPPPPDDKAMNDLLAGKTGGKEPNFGEKLGTLAKKWGVPLLHLLQAGAYRYAGVDKKTALQEIQERQHEMAKTREGQKFLAQQKVMDQQFAKTLTDIQARYQQQAATAQTEAQKAAAAEEARNAMERLKVDAAEAYKRAMIQQRPTLFSIAGGIPGLGGAK